MAKKRAKGGNVTTAQAAARVNIAEKSALIAVPVPNAKAQPEVIKATNITEAASQLKVSFKIRQTKLDGSSVKEEIHIKSLDDFEEANIVDRSATLREQQGQMIFLHDFQNELRSNQALREELKVMLQEENKEKLIQFLKGWVSQFKKPEQQFLQRIQFES